MKTIHTPEYRELLAWLRERRKAEGLTMRVVGEAMNTPHSWVGKVEIGERRLDLMEYARLCRVLKADAHEGLALLEGNPRRPGRSGVRT